MAEILGDEFILKPGEYAVFINRSWTALKMLTPNREVLLHLRRPGHKPINPETIRHLPNCIEGPELNYKKALGKVITDRFARDADKFKKHLADLRKARLKAMEPKPRKRKKKA